MILCKTERIKYNNKYGSHDKNNNMIRTRNVFTENNMYIIMFVTIRTIPTTELRNHTAVYLDMAQTIL